MDKIELSDREHEVIGRFLDMIENMTHEIKRMNDLKEEENKLRKDGNHTAYLQYKNGYAHYKV